MSVNREMIHDIVEAIPESEITMVYDILISYLSDEEEELTEEEGVVADEGFAQIARGEFITLDAYKRKRALYENQ